MSNLPENDPVIATFNTHKTSWSVLPSIPRGHSVSSDSVRAKESGSRVRPAVRLSWKYHHGFSAHHINDASQKRDTYLCILVARSARNWWKPRLPLVRWSRAGKEVPGATNYKRTISCTIKRFKRAYPCPLSAPSHQSPKRILSSHINQARITCCLGMKRKRLGAPRTLNTRVKICWCLEG